MIAWSNCARSLPAKTIPTLEGERRTRSAEAAEEAALDVAGGKLGGDRSTYLQMELAILLPCPPQQGPRG